MKLPLKSVKYCRKTHGYVYSEIDAEFIEEGPMVKFNSAFGEIVGVLINIESDCDGYIGIISELGSIPVRIEDTELRDRVQYDEEYNRKAHELLRTNFSEY